MCGLEDRCSGDVTDNNTRGSGCGQPELGLLLGALASKIASQSPDLAAVIQAWPDLPEAVKAGILAMVGAARTDNSDGKERE